MCHVHAFSLMACKYNEYWLIQRCHRQCPYGVNWQDSASPETKTAPRFFDISTTMNTDWYRDAIGSVLMGSTEGILQVQGLQVPQDSRFQTGWVLIDKHCGYWLIQMFCRQYPQEANRSNWPGGSFNAKTILADSEMSKRAPRSLFWLLNKLHITPNDDFTNQIHIHI